MDGFAVLAANIQDRVNRGIKIMGSPAMAGDLCDIFIRKINADAAVPRGDHKIQIFLRKSSFFKNFPKNPLRALPALCPCADHMGGQNFLLLIDDHRVGRCGTAVNTKYIHMSVLHTLFPSCHFFTLRIQRLQKSLHPGLDLTLALLGGVGLHQKQRHANPLF